jgi:hypothetical protein
MVPKERFEEGENKIRLADIFARRKDKKIPLELGESGRLSELEATTALCVGAASESRFE